MSKRYPWWIMVLGLPWLIPLYAVMGCAYLISWAATLVNRIYGGNHD